MKSINLISGLRTTLSFVFAMLITSMAWSQIFEPVKWNFSSEMTGDNEAVLIFKADIEPHWHLYSQDIPMAPPATTFFFEGDTSLYDLLGDMTESESIEEFDPNFDMVLKYFSDEAEFRQKIKLLTDGPVIVKGFVNFMSCDDMRCLPPEDVEFEFPYNGASTQLETSETALQDGEYKSTTVIIEDKSILDEMQIEGLEYSSIWELFIFAFIAGLIAILTPCVFPMIPMTVSFFMHDGDSKAKAKFQAIIFGLSIIFIYTVIGTVIALTLGVNFANWLSTHWIPNVLFFLIFVIFAASFFGMFEITLPSWMVNKSDQRAERGGITGPFFMAFTLVLVSFSCTGPLVGTVLVQSATGAWLEPIIGMLGFSLAFALPFTLFAFFPSWLNKLPKSGGWLNSVKVVLGFLELALGLKFLSIADQTYHWGILDREVYLALWIVIFVLMGFYLLGKIKFAHDSDVKFISVPRLTFVIITFAFVMYLIPGMFGAPLKFLSGYLPPAQTHDFDINTIVRENVKILAGEDETPSICETPKYHEFLHLPHGLEGYFDYEQGLSCAKKLNKPLFIDFTGHGCVNCREMEANVWADPKVLKRLQDDYVMIALYVDDKTLLPESEWVRSSADGKLKKTVGKIYADLQIHNFNINAQPYYVLLGHDGEFLVKPRAYDLDVEEFVKFLDEGKENFEKIY
ncbi:MAG: thioredoxin family protein [Bacteroidetes bacterium]|nr:thioredoxin family protein [Bacteroidota bacterium]